MTHGTSDIDQYVQEKIASGEFSSREEFAHEAFRVYRELEAQHAELRAEVARRIAQADCGQVGPLELDVVKAEGRRRLSKEGSPD
jgi:putative addiction module CopG family antidote